MADWRKRAKITDDVIYFPYISETAAFEAREVFLWDVDKTYLDTKFETVRGLIRTATEKANQKKNIPGSAELVTSLKDAWVTRSASPFFPIFFITASPPQMEKKINEKLALDGIKPFGIFCKDNLPNLRPRRFWRLNKQVGFKLQALLQMRALLKDDVRLIMFGDDGEFDAVIYSLFSDICARRLDTSELRKILNAFFVLDAQVDQIFQLQAAVSQHDPVEKIYINLADDTDSDYYLKFGRRTVPTSNNLQVAFDLYQDQRLELEHVAIIAHQMIKLFHFTVEEVDASLDDLIRREKLAVESCAQLIPFLQKENCLSPDFQPTVKPKTVTERAGKTVTKLDGSFDPWVPEHVDYLHDYR
jgi:hypothetical protein